MQDWRGRPESAAEYGVLLASEVMVPMRDGVRMATDLYFPADPEKPDVRTAGEFPTILIRTPYNKRDDNSRQLGEYFAQRGYAVVIQDCRGRYRSEGTFYFLTQEPEDGYDTVEWVAAQQWSNGKVGMMGTSYLGWTQMAAAVLNPPHLSTMVINQAGANAYTSSVRQNGAMELRFLSWAFLDAATGPPAIADPALKASFEEVFSSDWLSNLPWRPGQTPLSRVPHVERWALDLYTNGDYSDYWEHPGFNFMKYWSDHSDIPMLLSGAWYDSYTRATVENYVGLTERKQGPIHLLMGPWTHGGATVDVTFAGDVELGPTASVAGNLAENFTHFHLHWFDHWLKEMDNGVDREGPVRIFVMSAGSGEKSREGRLVRGGEWRTEQEFPLARATDTPFYLQPEGDLSGKQPDGGTESTTFTFDPRNPVPTIGGNISSLNDQAPAPADLEGRLTYESRWRSIVKVGGQDQRTGPDVYGAKAPYMPLSARDDVVVFQSAPLEEDMEVTGPLSAVLYVSSDAPDTDFTIKLVDVFPPSRDYPQGYDLNISDTIFRCRYRNDPANPEMMEQGEVYKLEIPMYGTSAVFGKGHRIRVDISSSNFPRFDINPNTGEPIGKHQSMQSARNTIHHSAAHPSHIVLPIVPAGKD